ncbi:hypothetical protein HC928_24195 [bacterium]|nr:hypothetical protein [bacterium]
MIEYIVSIVAALCVAAIMSFLPNTFVIHLMGKYRIGWIMLFFALAAISFIYTVLISVAFVVGFFIPKQFFEDDNDEEGDDESDDEEDEHINIIKNKLQLADNVALPLSAVHSLALGGKSGSGKSTYATRLIQQYTKVCPDHQIVILDPHFPNEQSLAHRVQAVCPDSTIVVYSELAEIAEYIEHVYKNISTVPPQLIVIDELTSITQRKAEVKIHLTQIAQEGRKFQIGLWLIAHNWTAKTLTSELRDNIKVLCCLTLRKNQAATMLGYVPEIDTGVLKFGEIYIDAMGIEQEIYTWQ